MLRKHRLGDSLDGGLGMFRERDCIYFIALTDVKFTISERDLN